MIELLCAFVGSYWLARYARGGAGWQGPAGFVLLLAWVCMVMFRIGGK